jgi:fucose permease
MGPTLGSATPERFVRHRATWAAYGLVGYFAYFEAVLGPLMPFLRAERNFDYTSASLHFSAFALGGVVVGLVGDRVAVAVGRGRSLWGGGVGMAAGALLLAVGPTMLGTLAGAFVMGVFGALLLLTAQAALADSYGRWSAVVITESNVAASACAIAAPVAVGALSATELGWRGALVPPVVALGLLAVTFYTEPLGAARRATPAPGVAGFRIPLRYWAYWGVVVLGVAVEWCMAYWGADFLENGTGLERSRAATALSVFFAAMLAGRLVGSRLARRVEGASLLLVTLLVALVGFPAFWLSEIPALALVGLFVTGLGVGSVYPMSVSGAVDALPHGTDTATARLGIAGGGAVLVAPLLLGAFADSVGIVAAFGAVVIPLLVAAVSLSFLARRLPAAELRREER